MKLEELMKEKRDKIWVRCFLSRGVRKKPRDKEKERILILADYIKFKKYIEERKLEIIGDRKYRLNF